MTTVQQDSDKERLILLGLQTQQQEESRPEQILGEEEPLIQWVRMEQEPRPESVQQFVALTQHGTYQEWLRWLGEQVSSVADEMDDEHR